MSNVTGTDVVLRVCVDADSISPTLVSFMQGVYFYYLAFPLFCAGITFGFPDNIVRIVGWLLQLILGQFVGYLQNIIAWQRPSTLLAKCQHPAILFDDAVNYYGAPDRLLTAAYIYVIVVIFIRYKIHQQGVEWLLLLITIIVFVAQTITEFVLQRLFVLQYFTNLALIALIAPLICFMIKAYTDHVQNSRYHLPTRNSNNSYYAALKTRLLNFGLSGKPKVIKGQEQGEDYPNENVDYHNNKKGLSIFVPGTTAATAASSTITTASTNWQRFINSSGGDNNSNTNKKNSNGGGGGVSIKLKAKPKTTATATTTTRTEQFIQANL